MGNHPFAFRFEGSGGRVGTARSRGPLTRKIYGGFPALLAIRDIIHRNQPIEDRGGPLSQILPLAVKHRVLRRQGKGFVPIGNAERSYLLGGWLEEFAALALIEAGCRDVRYAQPVSWLASTDSSRHWNEIDALGMYGDKPVLVSCKAVAEDTIDSRNGDDRLFDALLELSYWNAHFADRAAVPVFFTTADFYDEERQRFRSPKLVERAKVLDLAIVPVDFGSFGAVVAHLKRVLAHTA
ncbi:MAG: hypothetical protein C0606_16845 [Hyphomicrobiales bacterium]|nr:MAG: hypothetical protein C0606_16845 [Hyphomicrobiales bacterium]